MLTLVFLALAAAISLGGWWLVRQANEPRAAAQRQSEPEVQPPPQGSRRGVISRVPWPLLMAVGLGLTILGYATGSTSYVGGLVGLGFALFLAGMVRPLLRSERGDQTDQ